MAKLNPVLLKRLMFITLVAVAFGFVVGVNWHSRQPTAGVIEGKDSTLQPSSVEPAQQEIASNSEGKASQQQSFAPTGKGIIPVGPKPTAIVPRRPFGAIAPPPLLPNLPQANTAPPAQVFRGLHRDKLNATNSSRTYWGEPLPAFVNPDIPKANTAPSGQRLQTATSDKLSPENLSTKQPSITFWTPLNLQGKILKKIIPVNQEKVIALTFDDGPWPSNTLKILNILKKNNIKATFFWVGEAVKEHPQIAKQVVAEGHVIGNHTWHHWYHKLAASTAAHEIDDTAELIYKTTGVKTSLFRPPGGVMNNGVVDYAIKKKNVIVMWSNDPMDYRPLTANQLVNNVMRKAKPGAIILMHDGGGNHPATVQALPQIIAKLRKQRYKFITIPELLKMRDLQKSEIIAKKDSPSIFTGNP